MRGIISKKTAAKKLFTLIELLVVIAVIAILLSLLMPALKQAKLHASASACLNGLRQTGISLMSYADSWKGWAPQPYDGVKTWGDVLANSEGITNRNSMVCPSAKPNVFTSFSNTYGMWAYENTYATNLGGNFKGTQGIPYTAKGPGSQIFIADSGSASTDQTQVYYIYGWVSSMRFFDLRHSMRCNAFFADGHAAGFGAAQTRELGIRYYMINSSVLENTPPVP